MRLLRRTFLLSTLLLPFATAQAATRQSFDPAAFQQAQAAGKSILVHVTAPWCPTCKRQKPIVAQLEQDAKFGELMIFEVDFDSQKDALQLLQVQAQSTMIAFKGKTETGRAVGITDPEQIEALMDKAL
ncbi:thioredoxin family protein [Dongia sp. agr-C8]